MPEYIVKVVEPELLDLWHELHPLSGRSSDRAVAKNLETGGALSRTIDVTARSRKDAIRRVREMHPGLHIIEDATEGPYR